jgi:hypothetical protein
MSKILKWISLFMFCAAASAQVAMVGSGDPRQSNPIPSCAYTKIYLDSVSGIEYTASGTPCVWTPSGISAANTVPLSTFYLDGTRTDSYTATGSQSMPFKTLDALFSAINAYVTAGGTGPIAIWSNPAASYSTANAITVPAIPLIVYGNNSTWTFSAGVTNNAIPFTRYEWYRVCERHNDISVFWPFGHSTDLLHACSYLYGPVLNSIAEIDHGDALFVHWDHGSDNVKRISLLRDIG